jgi:hypothetical protein
MRTLIRVHISLRGQHGKRHGVSPRKCGNLFVHYIIHTHAAVQQLARIGPEDSLVLMKDVASIGLPISKREDGIDLCKRMSGFDEGYRSVSE